MYGPACEIRIYRPIEPGSNVTLLLQPITHALAEFLLESNLSGCVAHWWLSHINERFAATLCFFFRQIILDRPHTCSFQRESSGGFNIEYAYILPDKLQFRQLPRTCGFSVHNFRQNISWCVVGFQAKSFEEQAFRLYVLWAKEVREISCLIVIFRTKIFRDSL